MTYDAPTRPPTPAPPQPAAALVVDAHHADLAPRRVELVPVQVIDFYPESHA